MRRFYLIHRLLAVLLLWPVVVHGGFVTAEHKSLAHQPGAFDMLGNSVAVEGDTAVVGGFRHGDDDSGAAYVYLRRDGRWLQTQKLVPRDPSANKLFGRSVAIKGDYIIVGAVGDNANGFAAGAAYVFNRKGDSWLESAKLMPGDGASGDQAGWSVALSGNTAVIGAYLDDDNGSESGSVYVFTRNGTVWTEEQKLVASDGDVDERFGLDVAIDGDRIVVSAMVDDDNGPESGSAYVFTRSAGVWSEQQKLLASDGAAYDRWAVAVEIEGDTIAVGGWRDDDAGIDAGSVYILELIGNTWTETQKLLASDATAGDEFGYDISLSGDVLLVGAFSDDELGSIAGSAYVFERSGGIWSETEKILAADGATGDQFGVAVDVAGDVAVVGAWWNGEGGDNAGAAYFYSTEPYCDLELNQSSFVDGEIVWANTLRLLASDKGPVAIEWKVWLSGPGDIVESVINVGADGGLVLGPGTDIDLGPVPLFQVAPVIPRGEYYFNCRFSDPVSGTTRNLTQLAFELQ